MKIVAVLGSPRPQGNSAGLARQFLAEARNLGAEVQEYLLNQMTFQGCQGCLRCKTESDLCVLEDEATPILAAIREAQVLVLASPVYYGDLIGQLKCFFDRTYSYFNPDFSSRVPPGKKAVLILAQANPDPEEFADIYSRYKRWLKLYGFDPVYLLRAVGVKDMGDIDGQPELLNQAAALARDIIRAGS
jgi:multimeric flavodoxin WrbA